MGNGVDAQIDTLKIKIETNIDESSAKNVQDLSDALSNLKTTLSDGWKNLDDVVKKISKLGTINQISFSGFNNQLQTVTSNISPLSEALQVQSRVLSGNLSNALQDYNARLVQLGATTEQEKQALAGMDEDLVYLEKTLKSATAQSLAFNNQLQKLSQSSQRIDTSQQTLAFNEQKNAIRSLNAEYNTYAKTLGVLDPKTIEMANSISAANDKLKELGIQLTQLDPTQTERVTNITFRYDEVLRRIGIAQTLARKESDNLSQSTNELGKTAERASSIWDKFTIRLKRILIYRLIRRAIQLIGKEIITSISNFAQFDEKTNQSISSLQSSWKAFSNSIGIVASQLIVAIEPVLIRILDTATDVSNAISLIFAELAGEDYYSKAIKYETNFAEAVEKTNKQLLSFDRFEVLQPAAATSPEQMFETVDVATGLLEANNATLIFRDILKTLYSVFDSIWERIQKIFGALLPHLPAITKAIGSIVSGVLSLIEALSPAVTFILELNTRFIEWLGSTNAIVPALAALIGGIMAFKMIKEMNVTVREFNQSLLDKKKTIADTNIEITNYKTKMEELKTQNSTATDSVKNTNNALISQYDAAIKAREGIVQQTDAMINAEKRARNMQLAMKGLSAIVGAAGLGASLGDLINGWKDMDAAQKITRISTIALTAAYTALAVAQIWAQSMKLGIVAGIIAAVGAVGTMIAALTSSKSKVETFADGGIPDTRGGSLFVMNDGGNPELIHENSRGQVQISNQDSIFSAMLAALRQHDIETQGRSQTVDVNVGFNINGNALARALNPHIRQEMIRTGNR